MTITGDRKPRKAVTIMVSTSISELIKPSRAATMLSNSSYRNRASLAGDSDAGRRTVHLGRNG
jgi:hypothetical protein